MDELEKALKGAVNYQVEKRKRINYRKKYLTTRGLLVMAVVIIVVLCLYIALILLTGGLI